MVVNYGGRAVVNYYGSRFVVNNHRCGFVMDNHGSRFVCVCCNVLVALVATYFYLFALVVFLGAVGDRRDGDQDGQGEDERQHGDVDGT